MKGVIQRVSQASVSVDSEELSKIGPGLVVLLGLHQEDTSAQFSAFSKKLLNLRIFPDSDGKMNRNIQDIQGEILLISQFTVYGDCKKGTRPNFMAAMPFEKAEPLFAEYVTFLKTLYPRIQTGKFGAKMEVSLTNDGPVTLVLE